jgi:ankyrin repeat protein
LTMTMIEKLPEKNLNTDENTPQERLWTHMGTGDLDMVRKALKDGADPNFEREGEQLPLALAYKEPWHERDSKESAIQIVSLLLRYGANPNILTKTIPDQMSGGRTPLFLFTSIDDIQSVKALFNSGANIEAKVDGMDYKITYDHSWAGMTALHMACSLENGQEIVIFLLENGANFDAVNSSGKNVWHFAKINKVSKTIPILQAYKDRRELRQIFGIGNIERNRTIENTESDAFIQTDQGNRKKRKI